VGFEDFLAELKDESASPRYSQLLQLSALPSESLQKFKAVWPLVSEERKRAVLGRLVDLSEDNLELDFSSVFKVSLADKEAGVREMAVRGLWESEDRTVIRPLLRLLEKDPATEVRATAAAALGKFAELARDGKLLTQDESRIQAAFIAAIGRDGEDLEVRRRAIEAIASLDSPLRDRIIQAAYDSDDSRLLQSSIYAMGRSADVDWLPTVVKETGHESPAIRYEAAVACGHLGKEGVVPHLISLLQDEDLQVQLAAVKALGEVGGPLAKRALNRCLEMEDEVIEQAAEEALGDIEFDEDPLALRFD